jgi:hypothetical protein
VFSHSYGRLSVQDVRLLPLHCHGLLLIPPVQCWAGLSRDEVAFPLALSPLLHVYGAPVAPAAPGCASHSEGS